LEDRDIQSVLMTPSCLSARLISNSSTLAKETAQACSYEHEALKVVDALKRERVEHPTKKTNKTRGQMNVPQTFAPSHMIHSHLQSMANLFPNRPLCCRADWETTKTGIIEPRNTN
jgi:hypothetical protein